MTATALLTKLTKMGVVLTAYGNRLRVDTPTSVLTAELRQALVEHKADLLQLLNKSPGAPAPFQREIPPADCLSDAPCTVCGSHNRWRWFNSRLICRECLIRGDASVVAVKVWSDVLHAEIWVLANDLARDDRPREGIIYFHEEMQILTKVGADILVWVHPVKELFNARVVKGYYPKEDHRTRPTG